MATYNYSRELNTNGKYNGDNGNYVDASGCMIPITKYLNGIFSPIKFNMIAVGTSMDLISSQDLDAGQITTLTSSIAAYKAL